MTRTPPLVELRDVVFGYGAEVILDRVSLQIHDDDFLAIIGPNGGGKTTLLKVILGLLDPWSGEVVRRIPGGGACGWVPQFATFDKDFPLRVRDVVRMGRLSQRRGRRRRGDGDDRDDETLRRLGLIEVADEPVGELSGGQLQRTLIARALVGEPQILFLDEPLASVDLELRESLIDVLVELNRTIPVVVVTHDLTPFAGAVRQIACVNRRLHYHPEGRLTPAMLEEVYGCPVELIAHGVPHRVLEPHAHEPGTGGRE
ncbi:MAG TPA: ATP-binding cassette domain-containing protein [Thermoanaerobaculia bacterium]|nr:ATP-binding cassette domain-containing protein [Thermoanaerobaculia bacterium]